MRHVRNVAGTVVLGALLVVLGYSVANAQDIRDWYILRSYEPTARIAEIATNTSMNETGRKLFYVHDPQIETKSEFNDDCTTTESSLVLGCYNGVQIYIYDVTDERLKGIHEVTAAHEMLHAAYDRLSDKDREYVDSLTAKQLTGLSNERIQAVIKSYRARDPGIVPNELHSILGSEIRNLDPELEEYYKKYFDERLKVVAFSEQYEQVFTSIQAQVERYDAELQLLKAQIEKNEAELNEDASRLNAKKAELNRLSASGQIREYNDQVPSYNSEAEQYNADVGAYRERIVQYNELVNKRNDLTLEQNELIQSIDSRAPEI